MSDYPQDMPANFANGRRGWTSADPVYMPPEPVYKFSDSALQVGHFKEDLPDEISSANRKKNAKAYLMAVDKYIQMTEGIVIKNLKDDLVEMYNFQEKKLVERYNYGIIITMSRRAIVKFVARGTAEPPVIDDEDQPEQYFKQRVFCSETDPELN
ncbi:uncharacterized protein BKA55DRAFT_692782 [Fusarium redolens]|uniref:Uncharacterized protein n=1 Tax=Fusarium redolens TaxID=48865 RepID=A0A9P9GQ13_FUSRE|nr:uncharacterized protein BKA55DRAFT_692782 [Fusarium redolens]KAH7243619.1 hypothetical protein BKA55DRAFT_692782 [Fusarium redolens]